MFEQHLALTAALPTIHAEQRRVFVHAVVHPTISLDDQTKRTLLWSWVSNALGFEGKFVVHGHTPHRDGPNFDGQSINLETLAWATGRLVSGVFDDDRASGPTYLGSGARPARRPDEARSASIGQAGFPENAPKPRPGLNYWRKQGQVR